jgi:hypothetical protein
MNWARVTMRDGAVLKPVLVHDDGIGLRFYATRHNRVYLLAAAPGLRIVSFGERQPGASRKDRKPVVFDGVVPAEIATIERLETCGCGSALKGYMAPREWETPSVVS